MDYQGVKTFILNKLTSELNPNLYYHDLSHTMDVLDSVERLADMENLPEGERTLIRTASLFHDSGMLKTYIGHEEASCEITQALLPGFGYSEKEISSINSMIMATKLPQSAQTKNEQIICDADLDYLGRKDFFMISHRLRYEWDLFKLKSLSLKEWYFLQIDFLNNHTYFTKSAIETREMGKQQNLNQILEILNGLKR